MKPYSIKKQLMTLDEDEKELLDSVEKGEWISDYETLAQFESRKTELMKAAQDTLNIHKDMEEIEITIHLPQNIFQKIITSAEKAGIHYQNWITNTLQKVVG
ncbi:Uncharacterized protein dnl_58520 [Desulfonema limicola]|uniref:Uncharacterized protein n=1 Tax=Desulfonema limicola TaxID=45656 RepID=A0A975GJG7_9BACT|nr:hypothetical protein [Desulfonema limicola]QTA83445.1 Uncharacterized protein dnl_58520 [Desulfonema limicola]